MRHVQEVPQRRGLRPDVRELLEPRRRREDGGEVVSVEKATFQFKGGSVIEVTKTTYGILVRGTGDAIGCLGLKPKSSNLVEIEVVS